VPHLLGGASWGSKLRRTLLRFRAPVLRDALNPVLAGLGLPSRPLPLQRPEWLFLGTLLLLVASIAAAAAFGWVTP
jgi:hypothetical protein